MQQLFKIKLLNNVGSCVENRIDVALATIPENSDNLNPIWKFVCLRNAPATITLLVVSGGNIYGCEHIGPEIATCSNTGDGR